MSTDEGEDSPSGTWEVILDKDVLPLLEIRRVDDQAIGQRKRVTWRRYYSKADSQKLIRWLDIALIVDTHLPPDLGGGGFLSLDLLSNSAAEGSLYGGGIGRPAALGIELL